MLLDLIPFQEKAEIALRRRVASALRNYKEDLDPQVVSFTAPTGSGKTIIMTQLMEDIFFGMSKYDDVHKQMVSFDAQPDAIFVWLSDSPELNLQSKDKIDLKSDKIKVSQCVVIEDDTFDMETLEDGNIYFLNTQKIGKKGRLTSHSDDRQYTIWETLENTAREKSDRFYFIIDEAHRGMRDTEAGRATTIMQKFIKGSEKDGLSPMPVVIGMSATIERFNNLIAGTQSALLKVDISAEEVRSSGLLKDRIIITHPEDLSTHNNMTILKAATLEWADKCLHWDQYCKTQHDTNVDPVFVVQVRNGSGDKISDTNLEDCLATIEETLGVRFNENEVVHSFGDTADFDINGLTIHHVNASEISEDHRIKVVFFKENLSTGWDCPRAETMMSFRKVDEYTNIAQLLGRMVRTPLQRRIKVDMSLNDVRLYLPYYDSEAVKKVIENLQAAEGGTIPAYVDDDPYETPSYERWTANPTNVKKTFKKVDKGLEGQTSMFGGGTTEPFDFSAIAEEGKKVQVHEGGTVPVITIPEAEGKPPIGPSDMTVIVPQKKANDDSQGTQTEIVGLQLDRNEIIDFINQAAFLNYEVRSTETQDHFTALLKLCRLLLHEKIDANCYDNVKKTIVEMIHNHVETLKKAGEYEKKATEVTSLKYLIEVFTPFGEVVPDHNVYDLLTSSTEDLDRQVRNADLKLGGIGIQWEYARTYPDDDFRADVILFAINDECLKALNQYAKTTFYSLCDNYRPIMASYSEQCARKYDSIVTSADPISEHNFAIPKDIDQRKDEKGKEYQNHLLVNDDGIAKIQLNAWEEGVLEEEFKRPDFVTWLRNPSRGSWALRMPYKKQGKDAAMYPDFIIIRRDSTVGYIMDILEPHSRDFSDNLEKAKALAEYARRNPKIGRVQLIREKKNDIGKRVFVRLDMANMEVRDKVSKAVTKDEIDHLFDTHGYLEEA